MVSPGVQQYGFFFQLPADICRRLNPVRGALLVNNTVVIGIQWGDEGKGKIVDWLAEKSDVVVRFQGGNNAGHTLVLDGKVFKLSMLPSGIVRPGKLNVIGNGVVLDPWSLFAEIDSVIEQGIKVSPENLVIAENTPLVLPLHRELDILREQRAGSSKIGTTGRGIGPTYEDKVARRAVRVADLGNQGSLDSMIGRLLDHHNVLRAGYGAVPVDGSRLKTELLSIAGRLLEFAGPVWRILNERAEQGKSILFEGAQGSLLDIDHGTYPFVTSSSTVAGAAAAGTGIAPGRLGYILGVCKAYTTRVGSGPFPTELSDEVAHHLATVGHERGTVTGRARRCGWFDAVLAGQVCKLAGVDGLALTKLDVLDSLETLKICTGYRLDGNIVDRLPATADEQGRLEPIYETLPGWEGSVASSRSIGDMPENARNYVARIEQLTGRPVNIVSTSPDRLDTAAVSGPFA